jgi:hypothetical protein
MMLLLIHSTNDATAVRRLNPMLVISFNLDYMPG